MGAKNALEIKKGRECLGRSKANFKTLCVKELGDVVKSVTRVGSRNVNKFEKLYTNLTKWLYSTYQRNM